MLTETNELAMLASAWAEGSQRACEGGAGLKLQVAARPVVHDCDRFDPGHGMARAFQVGDGRDSER